MSLLAVFSFHEGNLEQKEQMGKTLYMCERNVDSSTQKAKLQIAVSALRGGEQSAQGAVLLVV